MYLRFAVEDLAQTRFVISPLQHALFGALCIHHPELAAPGSIWRDLARAVPARSVGLVELIGHAGARAALLGRLLWVEVPGPDTGRISLGDELDALTDLSLVAPPAMAYAGAPGGVPPRSTGMAFTGDLWRLAEGPVDPAWAQDHDRVRRVMADGLHVIFHRFLAAEWPGMRRHLEADLARRTERTFEHGPGATLASVSPRLSWDGSGLTVAGAPAGVTALRGRGLQVSPIMSAVRDYLAVSTSPDRRRPVLSYPVAGPRSQPEATGRLDTLAALVGAARARTLRAIGPGCRTDELAGRLGVSPSTASQHAAILRNAGLVVTHRDGRAVRHVLTTLGTRLLDLNG